MVLIYGHLLGHFSRTEVSGSKEKKKKKVKGKKRGTTKPEEKFGMSDDSELVRRERKKTHEESKEQK